MNYTIGRILAAFIVASLACMPAHAKTKKEEKSGQDTQTRGSATTPTLSCGPNSSGQYGQPVIVKHPSAPDSLGCNYTHPTSEPQQPLIIYDPPKTSSGTSTSGTSTSGTSTSGTSTSGTSTSGTSTSGTSTSGTSTSGSSSTG